MKAGFIRERRSFTHKEHTRATRRSGYNNTSCGGERHRVSIHTRREREGGKRASGTRAFSLFVVSLIPRTDIVGGAAPTLFVGRGVVRERLFHTGGVPRVCVRVCAMCKCAGRFRVSGVVSGGFVWGGTPTGHGSALSSLCCVLVVTRVSCMGAIIAAASLLASSVLRD